MSTISKEWLQQKIADMEAARDEIPFGLDEDDSNTLAAMKLALASLEAEPVAWRHFQLTPTDVGYWILNDYKPNCSGVEPLFTVPPAPVSVPDEDLLHMAASAIEDLLDHCDPNTDYYSGVWADVPARLRRAAMLQDAEPVTTAYKLPANTPCKDAPEHIWLQTAGIWPENGEFSELTWCSENQHPDDTLYVRADVVTGNSPVVPDGWVACSERMPPQGDYVSVVSRHGEYVSGLVNDEWLELHDGTSFGMNEIYLWVPLPAVPQQEVK